MGTSPKLRNFLNKKIVSKPLRLDGDKGGVFELTIPNLVSKPLRLDGDKIVALIHPVPNLVSKPLRLDGDL